MSMQIGVRTLAVLTLVALATMAIVKPDLIGGPAQPAALAALSAVAQYHF